MPSYRCLSRLTFGRFYRLAEILHDVLMSRVDDRRSLSTCESLFIGLFLAWHILCPAYYYLWPWADPYDERFSWRMFSEKDSERGRIAFQLSRWDGTDYYIESNQKVFGNFNLAVIYRQRTDYVTLRAAEWLCGRVDRKEVRAVQISYDFYNIKNESNDERNICLEYLC